MSRFRPYPVALFAVVTLAIWGNRIWLAWTNDEDTVAEKLVWSLPITLFVLAALVTLVVMAVDGVGSTGWFAPLVRLFAAGTVLFWAVRAPMITLADHDVPFKVVHAVLAVVSITAALMAWRSVGYFGHAHHEDDPDPAGRGGGGPGADHRHAGGLQQR